jgi:nitrite reductase/ring-hydroxylating ferredoxin subunit
LHGTTLVCPWHAWEFDCRDNEMDGGLAPAKFPVKIEGDDILIDVP